MSVKALPSIAACALVTIAIGCVGHQSDTDEIQINLIVSPSPPVVGDADVTLTLGSATGEPITDAEVRLEGNMNHAGMMPSFADMSEGDPGRYTGTLDFTMSGDWFILVTAKMKDGRSVERKIDVPGVKEQ
jgi:hypothetical protein